jgi:hypothetical protein
MSVNLSRMALAQTLAPAHATIQNLDDYNIPKNEKTRLIEVLKEVSNILGDINPKNNE